MKRLSVQIMLIAAIALSIRGVRVCGSLGSGARQLRGNALSRLLPHASEPQSGKAMRRVLPVGGLRRYAMAWRCPAAGRPPRASRRRVGAHGVPLRLCIATRRDVPTMRLPRESRISRDYEPCRSETFGSEVSVGRRSSARVNRNERVGSHHRLVEVSRAAGFCWVPSEEVAMESKNIVGGAKGAGS